MEQLLEAFVQQEKIFQFIRDHRENNNVNTLGTIGESFYKYDLTPGKLADIVIGYIEYQQELKKILISELEEQKIELASLKSKIDKGEFSFETTVCACGSNCTCQCKK